MARESTSSMSVLLLYWRAVVLRLGSGRRLAIQAQRLVSEGDQHQHGRADHEGVDPNVEQQHRRQMDVPDERKVEVDCYRRKEWLGGPPDAHGGGARRQQTEGDPVLRVQALTRFDPDHAAKSE